MFGSLADSYLRDVDALLGSISSPGYLFMDNEEFRQCPPAKMNEIYWREMLCRAHLTALTAIKRSRRWIEGIQTAAVKRNLLLFAAAWRGLIESTADTAMAMIVAPRTLATTHRQIERALSGSMSDVLVTSEELEDVLIHYQFARRLQKGEVAPESHEALTTSQYLKRLGEGATPGIRECYGKLCDLTHPGASSVWMWLCQVGRQEFKIAFDQEEAIISSLLKEYESMFLDLFVVTFNAPVLTLAVLNYFPIPDLHTPILLKWDLSPIPAWKRIQQDLSGARIRVRYPGV